MEYLNKKYVKKKGIDMGSINAIKAKTAWDTKEVNRTINRYMSQAEKHLDNVCVGKFP